MSLFSLPNLLMQGYYGLPIAGSHWFPPGSASALYSESAAYLGVVTLVLAGAVMVVHIRKPMAAAFTAMAAAMAFAAFFGLGIVPIHLVALASGSYALMPMSFALAMLAGIGLNILISRNTDRRYLKWAGVGFGVVLALLLGLWALGSHRRNPLSGGQLSSAEASIRAHSFVGPLLCTVIGLAAVGIILRYGRRPAAAGAAPRRWPLGGIAQWTGMALLVVESVFLITAGAPLWPSNASFPAPTAAETALQQTVGSALVGVGSGGCSAYSWDLIGIVANDNILPGIRELSIYDPAAPSSYFTSWWAATGSHQLKYSNWFCPNVTTSQVARLYGVSYVLEVHDHPGPTGSVFVKSVGDEDLFRIPGASTATVVPLQAGGPPDKFVPGKPVPSTRPAPNQLRVSMDSSSTQVLRLREANVPGWKASIDGKPLALHKFAGLMLEATIPAGHHVIELTYWPPLFTAGLVLALLTVIGLVAALVVAEVRPRHARVDRLSGSEQPLLPMVPPRPTGSLRSARVGWLARWPSWTHGSTIDSRSSQTQSITLRAASPLCIDLNWCANSHAVNTPERRIRPNLSIRRCGADRTSCMNPASRRHLMAEFQNHEFDARIREETATTPRDPERTPRVVVRKDGTTAESYGPARGYSRRRFRPGNMANLRHGAYSHRVISAVAVDVGVGLLEIVRPSGCEPPSDKDPVKGSEG